MLPAAGDRPYDSRCCYLPGAGRTQGASPVTSQDSPKTSISAAQQSAPLRPGMSPQPWPPHCPHSRTQHTVPVASSMPENPLLQVEFERSSETSAISRRERVGKRRNVSTQTPQWQRKRRSTLERPRLERVAYPFVSEGSYATVTKDQCDTGLPLPSLGSRKFRCPIV